MSQLVDLKVGFLCNNSCIHCVISDKSQNENLSTKEIKEQITAYIEKYKTIQLTLTGGEVSIRKDFSELLDFVGELKRDAKITFVDIQTNGRLLANEKTLCKLVETVDFFLIALHGDEAIVHDEITQVHGSFQETVNSINELLKYISTKRIAVQTVINKKNFFRLKKLYEFIYTKLKLTECNITFPHPIGVCCSQDVTPTYRDAQFYINEALEYCLKNNIFPYIEAVPPCVLNSSNRKYLFEFQEKYNISSVGYAGEQDGHLDYSALHLLGHAKYESCRVCKYFAKCEGVWKEYKLLYPEEDMFALLRD